MHLWGQGLGGKSLNLFVNFDVNQTALKKSLKHKTKNKTVTTTTKQDANISCLQEIHLIFKDMHRLKVKGWKKISHANGNKSKQGALYQTK